MTSTNGLPAGVTYRDGGWYELPDGEKVRGIDSVRNRLAQSGSLKVDRMRFARKAGFQYGGDRDIYEVAGYIQEGNLTFEHYHSRYERQDIAGRIVDMPAQTTWRNPPEIKGPDGEETAFSEAATELVDDLQLWHRLERADRLAGIGRFGVLLIGVPGDESELSDPIPRVSGPEDILYLSAFHEGDVDVTEWVRDPGDPRFGHPLRYRIDLSSGVEGFPEADAIVHHSRVIHIAEDLLADEVFGRPRLKRVMNQLHNLEKVSAATAEAYWQLADKILVASVAEDAEIDSDTRKKLGEALEEVVHDLRRQMIGQGLSMEWLGGDTPDPSGPADLYMMLIAAASSIPKRILFGNETGERASTEDQKQWLGTVGERIERFAEPVILRPLLDRFIEIGALPSTEGYEAVWPNLFELDETQEAELSKVRAETAKILTPVGGNPMERVEVGEDSVVRLLTSEELEEVEEEKPLAPLMPPGQEGPTETEEREAEEMEGAA